jgi:radical SAM superfamily enzyme YgiQ (UPF0313 family)
MKILLVDPPGKNKGLNSGLGYLSAFLEKPHELVVLDLNNIKMGSCGDPNPEMPWVEVEREIHDALEEFRPDLFGVSVKTNTADLASRILKSSRSRYPNLLTAVGGPHISLDGSRFLRENHVDFGIQKEGEYSFKKLCDVLEERGSAAEMRNLLYWKDNSLFQTDQKDTIKDLDALPFPRFDNFTSVRSNKGIIAEYPLLTSRGCPFQCSYCSMPEIMGRTWRFHSPQRVIDELKHAKQKYRSQRFAVVDDNFTLDTKRAERICELFCEEKLNLPWTIQNGIRADRINESLAEKMKASKCQYVWVGIETADEDVFISINKGVELSQLEDGIEKLKQAGIRVGGFFITGLPESTRESDLKSMDFVKRHGIDGWWFNFVPYPHTKAWDWVEMHGKRLRSSEGTYQFGMNALEPVFETEGYPKDMRIKTYEEIHIKLGYFDRLSDPSLRQWKRWRLAFSKVRHHGSQMMLLFLLFVLKFNIRLAVKSLGGTARKFLRH